jgi:hypothetical protein
MRRAARIAGALASLAVAGLIGSCGEATQIVLDVRTNTCARNPTAEIVLARSLADLDSNGRSVVTSTGCLRGDEMGTLTILPRQGAEDGVVAIRVSAALDADIGLCAAQPDKCIVARAIAQFEKGRTTRTTVFLDDACVGVQCGLAGSCVQGRCVAVDLPGSTDGGVPIDASVPGDASDEASLDAAVDVTAPDVACQQCAGNGGACEQRTAPDGGATTKTCVITAGPGAERTIDCPAGIPCMVTCTGDEACAQVNCGPAVPSCDVMCNGLSQGNPVCNVACSSPRCRARCSGGSGCNVTSTNAVDTRIECFGLGACNNVSCNGTDCKRRAAQTCRTPPCVCSEGINLSCNSF